MYQFYTSLTAAILLFFFLAKLLLSHIVSNIRSRQNGFQAPPTYEPQSFLGLSLFREARKAGAEHKGLEHNVARFEKFGITYSGNMLGKSLVMTIDPENVKTVLATKFQDFGLGQRLLAFGPFIGEGIFTSDGPHWEHSRSLIRPNFTRAQVADLDSLEKHVQELISMIPKDGSTVDLQPLFYNMTLDSATEFLVGKSVDCQLAPEGSKAKKIADAFTFAEGQMSTRLRLGKLATFHHSAKFLESCRVVHEFFDDFIEQAIKESDIETDKDDQDGKRYIFVKELMKYNKNPKQLRDEALNVLIAGRDTTAGLLSNLFHALARHQRVWDKLQQEISKLGGKAPDYATIRGEMPYLKAVLNEALRLYPSVPANTRFANKDTSLPRGGGPKGEAPVFVPKGTIVMYSVYAMHRNKAVFGPDADEFRPERWDSNLRPGWGYLPFNGGPRVCIGQQYALTEAGYAIIRLLQTFKEMENRDSGPWQEHLSVTLSSKNGAKVGLTLR